MGREEVGRGSPQEVCSAPCSSGADGSGERWADLGSPRLPVTPVSPSGHSSQPESEWASDLLANIFSPECPVLSLLQPISEQAGVRRTARKWKKPWQWFWCFPGPATRGLLPGDLALRVPERSSLGPISRCEGAPSPLPASCTFPVVQSFCTFPRRAQGCRCESINIHAPGQETWWGVREDSAHRDLTSGPPPPCPALPLPHWAQPAAWSWGYST